MNSPEQSGPKPDESLSTVPQGTSRRGFIAGAASAPLAVGLLGGGLLGEAGARTRTHSFAADKSYSVERLLLSLDEKPGGFVKSAFGGDPYAEVKLLPSEPFDEKTIHDVPRYDDIEVQTPVTGMERRFFDWITATWKGSFEPRDGSVVSFDFNMKPQTQRSFQGAYITETTFPALDGSSKDAGLLTLNIDPTTTDFVRDPSDVSLPRPSQPKKWMASNFRLEIDGMDTSKVSKIDSFSVKLTGSDGGPPPPGEPPTKVQFSNLRITFSESSSGSWYKWFNKFVLSGNPEVELNGHLAFLDSTLSKELFSVDLERLGIIRLAPTRMVAGQDAIARVTAELYVENMYFNPPDG